MYCYTYIGRLSILYSPGKLKISNLGVCFALEMHSVLIKKKSSYPAMLFWNNWYTRDFCIFGPLVLEEYPLKNQSACTG